MKSLEEMLGQLYPGKSEQILTELEKLRPDNIKFSPLAPDWYKQLRLYAVLPDGYDAGDKPKTLYALAEQLKSIRDLGCNGLHILPFLESPMIDGGFDVSNYFEVREELGGMKAMDEVLVKAKELGMAVFMDLTVNHVSHRHGWFANAMMGDERHREYFVCQKDKPVLINANDNGRAVYTINGHTVAIPIIFPDQVGELPHWVKGSDGYWYFHTFYPYQLDVNWQNWEVFVEYAKVIGFWAQKGVHFRLDAVPHLDKDFGKTEIAKSTGRNMLIIETLRAVAYGVHPQSVLLVEVIDSVEQTVTYLGNGLGQKAELAYNSYTMNGMWASLLTGENRHYYRSMEQTRLKTPAASWVNFVRSHDAVMPGFIDSIDAKLIADGLGDKGLKFGHGLEVAGRTMTLVGGDSRKLLALYLMLAGLPGVPMVYYGDEFGLGNQMEYMDEMSSKRERGLGFGLKPDVRDVGRGRITQKVMSEYVSGEIERELGMIMRAREKYGFVAVQQPVVLDAPEQVVAMSYSYFAKRLSMLVNLSQSEVVLNDLKLNGEVVLMVNGAEMSEGVIKLPAYGGAWVLG